MISAVAPQTASRNAPLSQTKKLARQEWLLLLGAVLLALLVRLSLMRFQFLVTPDGVFYTKLAEHLATGDFAKGISTYWPPLYPILVGLASFIFHDLELSGRVISALAGSLIVIPGYLLAREFYGKTVAAIAAFLIIIHPPLVQYSTLLLTEAIYTLFFTIFMLAGWCVLARGNTRTSLIAGLSIGASYLIKPEAIAFLGLMVVLALCRNLVFPPQAYARILKNMLVLVLGFLLLAAPYLWFLRQETGKWTISEKFGFNFSVLHNNGNPWFRLDESGNSTLADRFWGGDKNGSNPSKTTESLAGHNPTLLSLLKRTVYSLNAQYEFHFPKLFSPLLFVFAAVGLFRNRWSKQRARQEAFLLLLIFSTFVGYALVVIETRYLHPLIPIILGWVAMGIVGVESWLLRSCKSIKNVGRWLASQRWLLRATALALLTISMLPWGGSLFFGGEERIISGERRKAGQWIKEHTAAPPIVMSPAPEVAFFANGQHVFLPDEDYEVMVAYARRRQVKYLVIDEYSARISPRWQQFLTESAQVPAFKPVYGSTKVLASKPVYGSAEISDFKLIVFELDAPPPAP